MACPRCNGKRLQIVLNQTAIYDPDAELKVSPTFDEEVNREGQIVCPDCFTVLPESSEIWEMLEVAFRESLESE
jgi:uncharacterized protein YbaR (Trm112 family)